MDTKKSCDEYDSRQKRYPKDYKCEQLCSDVSVILQVNMSMLNPAFVERLTIEINSRIRGAYSCTETESTTTRGTSHQNPQE